MRAGGNGGNTLVVAVSRESFDAYKRLPSTLRVNVVSQSPVLVRPRDSSRTVFVEYEENSKGISWRPLDVSRKPDPSKDPDVQMTGDLTSTFLGALCTLFSGFSSRHIASQFRIDCEPLEVARGGSGLCRLVPIDSLFVETNAEMLESNIRKTLLESISVLPLWVKEDGETRRLIDNLEAKKRREKNYENSVVYCLDNCRLYLGFEKESSFSDFEELSPTPAEKSTNAESEAEEIKRELNQMRKRAKKSDEKSDEIPSDSNVVKETPKRVRGNDKAESSVEKKKKRSTKGVQELTRDLVEELLETPGFDQDPKKALREAKKEARRLRKSITDIREKARRVIHNLDTNSSDFCRSVLELEEAAMTTEEEEEGEEKMK